MCAHIFMDFHEEKKNVGLTQNQKSDKIHYQKLFVTNKYDCNMYLTTGFAGYRH